MEITKRPVDATDPLLSE